jgi:hypothetical protein
MKLFQIFNVMLRLSHATLQLRCAIFEFSGTLFVVLGFFLHLDKPVLGQFLRR